MLVCSGQENTGAGRGWGTHHRADRGPETSRSEQGLEEARNWRGRAVGAEARPSKAEAGPRHRVSSLAFSGYTAGHAGLCPTTQLCQCHPKGATDPMRRLTGISLASLLSSPCWPLICVSSLEKMSTQVLCPFLIDCLQVSVLEVVKRLGSVKNLFL